MVEQQAQRTTVASPPGLLSIELIEHTVHEIAYHMQEEEPARDFIAIFVLKFSAELRKQHKEWNKREQESHESNGVWRQCHWEVLNQLASHWVVEVDVHVATISPRVLVELQVISLLVGKIRSELER